jgi:hypothetical protein
LGDLRENLSTFLLQRFQGFGCQKRPPDPSVSHTHGYGA